MSAVARNPWLPREPSPEATERIFCLPHAGYGAVVFGRWPERHDGVEFLPVEFPGRLGRFTEPRPSTIGDLARDMVDGLADHLDAPFAFVGHCWSALVAYEATAQLAAAGGPSPAHLYVSAQVAPQDGPIGRMLEMDDAALTVELESALRAQGSTPHRQLTAVQLAMLRSDVEMNRRYVVPDPLRTSCPITAIAWSGDDEVPTGRMTGWTRCGITTFAQFDGRRDRFLDGPAELLDTLCAGVVEDAA